MDNNIELHTYQVLLKDWNKFYTRAHTYERHRTFNTYQFQVYDAEDNEWTVLEVPVESVSAIIRMDMYVPHQEIEAALAKLDGTTASAVSLLSGVPQDQLDQYGGVPNE